MAKLSCSGQVLWLALNVCRCFPVKASAKTGWHCRAGKFVKKLKAKLESWEPTDLPTAESAICFNSYVYHFYYSCQSNPIHIVKHVKKTIGKGSNALDISGSIHTIDSPVSQLYNSFPKLLISNYEGY